MPDKRSSIVDLEEDVLLHICSLLDAIALSSLACTCRKLRGTSNSPVIWQRLVDRRWHTPNIQSLDGNIQSAAGGLKRLYVSANAWHGEQEGTGPPAMVCTALRATAYESPSTLLPLKDKRSSDSSSCQTLLVADNQRLMQAALSGPSELSEAPLQHSQDWFCDCEASPALASVGDSVAVGHAHILELHRLTDSEQAGCRLWRKCTGQR